MAGSRWANWTQTLPLNIAAHGSTSVTAPVAAYSSRSKPAGLFIQALTATMQNVPATPETMIGTSVARCSFAGRPRQPYR